MCCCSECSWQALAVVLLSFGCWDSAALGATARQPWNAAKPSYRFSSLQPAGFHWLTWGYQPQRTGRKANGEEGKGLFVLIYLFFFFSFYQAQFFGKKKRISLWAGALLGVLPSLASPSTPPSVQTAKQQFLETHWKVWASPEAGDSWYLHDKVLGSLLFTLILFKNLQLFEAHLLPTASVCKMRLKISSLEKFPKLLCSSVLPLTVWLKEYNGGKY